MQTGLRHFGAETIGRVITASEEPTGVPPTTQEQHWHRVLMRPCRIVPAFDRRHAEANGLPARRMTPLPTRQRRKRCLQLVPCWRRLQQTSHYQEAQSRPAARYRVPALVHLRSPWPSLAGQRMSINPRRSDRWQLLRGNLPNGIDISANEKQEPFAQEQERSDRTFDAAGTTKAGNQIARKSLRWPQHKPAPIRPPEPAR